MFNGEIYRLLNVFVKYITFIIVSDLGLNVWHEYLMVQQGKQIVYTLWCNVAGDKIYVPNFVMLPTSDVAENQAALNRAGVTYPCGQYKNIYFIYSNYRSATVNVFVEPN